MGQNLTITVIARKGGVGKTTIAASLASIMAARSNSTLLVDLDTQSSAASALGADPLQFGAAAWLNGGNPTPQEIMPGLQLLAGGPDLESIQRIDERMLQNRLEASGSRVIIFDTPASISSLTRAAMACSDVVLVVTEPHPLGLSGAASILESLRGSARRALVLSRLDLRRSLHRAIAEGIQEAFGGIGVFPVRHDAFLERAMAEGKPAALARRSRAVEDIEAIADWIGGLQ